MAIERRIERRAFELGIDLTDADVARAVTSFVLDDVRAERERQEQIGLNKAAEGTRWSSCADPAMDGGDDRRYVVLGEEVGEIARAMLEGEGDERLRAELVQVAAVAIAWAEAIDRRRADA